MAPIPVYTNSPIAASKPSGATPQTAESPSSPGPPTISASPTSPSQGAYPSARPGAAPSLPAPTVTAQAATPQAHAPLEPTGTLDHDHPPPPQPGAVPVPPGAARATIPPPPKVGEQYHPSQQMPVSQPASVPYPQQMAMPAPTTPYPSQRRGTSTLPDPTSGHSTRGSLAYNSPPTHSLEHPPGYHQNTNVSELDRYQRSAIRQNELEPQADDSGGVWEAAKKWAQQTGERLAGAEAEVWKKINKD
ncbi:hypothetical protein GGS23DRAFT_450494 [Durotheca rogersii]|uniref:uncharacterized protein n=1 Tax=Durotheca rogersii TaxID=419775 RepID=UPI00221E67DA|nr:uncharacterized protein GGS23DRAFT_450494 [Durotheca rogersii]KAI5864520.1 hypothetical protein GGS23DRAFT_450494 [Durotheca rogersii]